MTEEDRARAVLVKEQNKQWALDNLQQDFVDLPHWKTLASLYNVRLPIWYAKGTEIKYIKRIAKGLKVDISLFVEDTGFTNIKQLAQANINWPAYALCGLLLEWYDNLYGKKI